jgi:hypothetical protein
VNFESTPQIANKIVNKRPISYAYSVIRITKQICGIYIQSENPGCRKFWNCMTKLEYIRIVAIIHGTSAYIFVTIIKCFLSYTLNFAFEKTIQT